ncbi:hypothetical protein [Nocardiopsis sp. FIRDI 009]|uniref:hypothetical protein n=1 Tax=Nocardiopsis sp. FIRDI 009 TaxID=714197 RepID=UPI000E26FA30|nr:hypothetical protein [Nocardiopsis sp. FIRDI 009]
MRAMVRRWASTLVMTVLVLLILAWHGTGDGGPATPDQPGEPVAHTAPATLPAIAGGTNAAHDDPLHGNTALVPVASTQATPDHADMPHAGPADCSADAPACWTGHPAPDLTAPAPVPDVVLPPPPVRAAARPDQSSGAAPRAPDLAELSVLRI